MKPEAESIRLLAAVRSTAKMYEFRVASEDFIDIPRDPTTLFNLAVGILGDAAAALADAFIGAEGADGRPRTWTAEDGPLAEMVRFSATFFDAYVDARLDEDLTAEFSLLCASAYYLSDNVGSASVVARRSDAPDLTLAGGLALVAHSLLRDDFSAIDAVFPHSEFARSLLDSLLRFFNLTGDGTEVVQLCASLRQTVYLAGDARSLFYADLVTALCGRKMGQAARSIIPPTSNLPLFAWLPALQKQHFPHELWPAQRRICEFGTLTGRSAVIQMPTSAGKTRATELIIRAAFLSGRTSLAVIVAPFRSLCHDIRSDLVRAFDNEDITLDEPIDSYQLDLDLDDLLQRKTVLVVTPEKLLYMLRRAPELAERIGLAIYDEGHQFDGLTRGPTYELLLSSLRMSLPPHAQVVLISAVVQNAGEIADWLIGDSNAVIDGAGLLPSPKSIAFTSWKGERGRLRYVKPNDPEEQEFYVPRVLTSVALEKTSRRERERVFPERGRSDPKESYDVALYLALHLIPNGSAAIFCGQKAAVNKIARRAAEIFDRKAPLSKPRHSGNREQIKKLARLARHNLGSDSDLARAGKFGLFYHHGNTPHGLRLAIEHAMKHDHARLVVCTSTLAQGVNFPIKYLIVTGTQQGQEQIKVRDFHNLVGRAGRSGMHTEGSIIFSDPAIYDSKSADAEEWNAAKDLLNPHNSEPTRSSILDIFKSYDQLGPFVSITFPATWFDLAFASADDIESLTLAVKDRFPKVDPARLRPFITARARAVQSIASYLVSYVDFDSDLAGERVDELATNTLAHHLSDEATRAKLIAVFRGVSKSIEENGDPAVRTLIRKSPLPAAQILDLRDWIASELAAIQRAVDEGRLAEFVYAKVAPHLAETKSVRAISDKTAVLPALLTWIGGESFGEIRAQLVAAGVKFSTHNTTIEHVVGLCEGAFGYDLAMMVASVADLLEEINEDLQAAFSLLQRQVKCGLSSEPALAFFEAGFADRVVARKLARNFPGVGNRRDVRRVCRDNLAGVLLVLDKFPAYFSEVAREFSAS